MDSKLLSVAKPRPKRKAIPRTDQKTQISQTNLTTLQVAREFGVCKMTVHRLRRDGRLRAVVLSRKLVRYPIEEVARLKAEGLAASGKDLPPAN